MYGCHLQGKYANLGYKWCHFQEEHSDLQYEWMLFQEAYVDPRSQWIPFSRIINLRYESTHIFEKKFKASPQMVNDIVEQDGISSVLGRYI